MRHDIIPLSVPGAAAPTELVTYLPDNFPELGMDRRRPALILCPGGGYHFRSDREGEPVALRFAGLGYAVFLLRYHVDPHAVVTMGFSAGGHLACSAGVLYENEEILEPLGLTPEACRPDGMILGYPVITSGPQAHRGSLENLLGERYQELLDTVSLEKQVTDATPPVFLWHTVDDTTVPVENSLLLQEALENAGVPAEVHLYPHGVHGQSLADSTVFSPDRLWMLSVPCSVWVERCHAWLRRMFG